MQLPLRHRSNDITSGVIHLVAAGIALPAFVVLVVLAAIYGNFWHVISFTVYGVCMILLYLASTIYHLIPHSKERSKDIMQRIDHASVFIFIAATYTPVCFLVLTYPSNWIVLLVLWVFAMVGVVLKLRRVKTHYSVPLFMYLTMGWSIVLFFPTLLLTMTYTELTLLIVGGVLYTLGVVFFVLEDKVRPVRYFWMHEIFHFFVLAGSTLHTIMMFFLLYS